MAYERYTRGSNPAGDFGQDYGSGRDYTYSSARDYAAAREDDQGSRNRRDDDRSYGDRDYGNRGDYGRRDYGARSFGGEGSNRYGDRDRGASQGYRGSYASDGHRFTDTDQDDRSSWNRDDRYSGERSSGGRYLTDREDRSDHRHRDWGSRSDAGNRSYGSSYGERSYGDRNQGSRSSYGERSYGERNYGDRDRYDSQNRYRDDRDDQRFRGRPQGYDYDDRGFLDRAGDEVRSWFGDEEAERRREMDQRYDERQERRDDRYGNDSHYGSWRNKQLAEFDRDYDEYRQENASKFHNEFSNWRTERQGQRSSLNRVEEHMEVVGSDGKHVGTVDKVRGDRILLTKNDVDAQGRHHSIPSRWIETVDDKVKIRKTADEAKSHWRDEERNESMFGDDSRTSSNTGRGTGTTTGGTSNLSTIGSTANTGGTSGTGTAAGSTDTNTTPQGGSTFR